MHVSVWYTYLNYTYIYSFVNIAEMIPEHNQEIAESSIGKTPLCIRTLTTIQYFSFTSNTDGLHTFSQCSQQQAATPKFIFWWIKLHGMTFSVLNSILGHCFFEYVFSETCIFLGFHKYCHSSQWFETTQWLCKRSHELIYGMKWKMVAAIYIYIYIYISSLAYNKYDSSNVL